MVSSLCLPDDAHPYSPPDVSLEEIIFSCDICQATVSEVYATKERHEGFHSGSSGNDGDGIVTKFWIGACSHVFCGKHLDGGGVAFHPKDVSPNAGCPVCPKNLPSSRKQNLFAIRGLKPGEYDDVIPESWLRCPPTRLDAQDVEMDALRFQYQRLASYSRNVNKAWKTADSKRRIMERTLSSERKQWRKRDWGNKDALRERDALIEERDVKLAKWDGRKDVINHYMSVVGPMAKDIAEMRALLQELGYKVPGRDYSYQPTPKVKCATNGEQTQQGHRHDSSATLVGSNVQSSSVSRKRKSNNDAYADSQEQSLEIQRPQRNNERPMMMPPPLPKFRAPRVTDLSGSNVKPRPYVQRLDPPDGNSIPSGQLRASSASRQTLDPQQESAIYVQQAPSLSHEQSSFHAKQTAAGSFTERSRFRERGPSPALPIVHMYERTGWQDRPLPRDPSGTRHEHVPPSRAEHKTSPYMQKTLPHRGVQQRSDIERSIRLTQYDQPPSRIPLTRMITYPPEQISTSSRPLCYEPGGWRGVTLRGSVSGDHELRSTQMQPAQSRQSERRLATPSYQQPRHSHMKYSGTTTLSSEYRAQERPASSERLLSHPANRRNIPQEPLINTHDDAYLDAQPHAASEASYYDPVHGTLQQQSGESAPREMKGFYMAPSLGVQDVRASVLDGSRYHLSTSTYRKQLQTPVISSVVSPFFGQLPQRQSAADQQGAQELFSYAPAPSPAPSRVIDCYQKNDAMSPPPTIYQELDRSMQSRDAAFALPGRVSVRNGDPAAISTASRGSQRGPLALTSRTSQPVALRERVSLSTIPHLSRPGKGARAPGLGADDSRASVLGARPSRRSVRR